MSDLPLLTSNSIKYIRELEDWLASHLDGFIQHCALGIIWPELVRYIERYHSQIPT